MENAKKDTVKIIPLGGLEQIGMNMTAFMYETVLLLWIVVCHFRMMIC